MRSLARLARLPAGERALVLQSLVLLPAVTLALRAGGLAFTHEWLRRIARRPCAKAASDPQRLAFLVHAVARRLGLGCLARSLGLQFLLLRRGIESDLRIGVRREGTGLEAHAWVEHGGVRLGDESARFAAFADAIEAGSGTS